MELGAVVLPVDDVDAAKAFYRAVGFQEVLDYSSGPDFRVVQFIAPGSAASIFFGIGMTAAAPGSVQGLLLVVKELDAARQELLARGVDVGEAFYDSVGVSFHPAPPFLMVGQEPSGPRQASFARFRDPAGNGWVVQGTA